MTKLLAKVITGSRLFGLDDANSDLDIKGIYMPNMEELILGSVQHNIQSHDQKQNIDFETFSVQEFLKNCINAQDIAVVMLHAPKSKILKGSPFYTFLRNNKSKFYTKNMIGSMSFAKAQSMKYALRAERMNSVKLAIDKLQDFVNRGVLKIGQVWDELPENEYLLKTVQKYSREADQRVWEVCGKGCTVNTNPIYCLEFLTKLFNQYGERVKVAASLNERDWKSISHAFRTSYQLLHIYKDGGFTFPLPETNFIKSVKYGKEDFLKNNIDLKLNALISEVEGLAAASKFPEQVDSNWVNEIILKQYDDILYPEI